MRTGSLAGLGDVLVVAAAAGGRATVVLLTSAAVEAVVLCEPVMLWPRVELP